jgi:hypothetical protein
LLEAAVDGASFDKQNEAMLDLVLAKFADVKQVGATAKVMRKLAAKSAMKSVLVRHLDAMCKALVAATAAASSSSSSSAASSTDAVVEVLRMLLATGDAGVQAEMEKANRVESLLRWAMATDKQVSTAVQQVGGVDKAVNDVRAKTNGKQVVTAFAGEWEWMCLCVIACGMHVDLSDEFTFVTHILLAVPSHVLQLATTPSARSWSPLSIPIR